VFAVTGGLVFLVLSQRPSGLVFSYSTRIATAIVILAQFSSLLQWWAARKRYHMHAVSLGLILLDQVLFGGIAYITGGVASGATSLFGVSCLVGGLLLGAPGAVAAALAGGVCFSLIVLINQGAPSLLPPDQPAELYQLSSGQAAYYYVYITFMLVIVGLLSSYLAERLQRAGGELEVAHQRAAQAERMAELGKLAAGLAHEIRNPLSSISGAVQMLRSGTESEEDRELCDIVMRESKRLNELVSDMMDLSKPRQPQFERTDIARIVNDVVALAQESGRGGGDVLVSREGATHVLIRADSGQIRQLVWNLVRNAIQASGAGGRVKVRLEVSSQVFLSVEDEGMGIDSEAKIRLFDAYFTTRSQGTGLGLAVVKRIADEHGFNLTVVSEHGNGAQFIVEMGPAL
jgi:two-component system, NtrC family, sensor histidine kinase HydH